MNKTFIIAELSANHNHDKQVALDTIRAAKRCGADAVKIQTYTADTMTIDSTKNGSKFMVLFGMEKICIICIKRHILHGNGMKKFFMWQKKRG